MCSGASTNTKIAKVLREGTQGRITAEDATGSFGTQSDVRTGLKLWRTSIAAKSAPGLGVKWTGETQVGSSESA